MREFKKLAGRVSDYLVRDDGVVMCKRPDQTAWRQSSWTLEGILESSNFVEINFTLENE